MMRLVAFRTDLKPCSGGIYKPEQAAGIVRSIVREATRMALAADQPDPELTLAALDPNDLLNSHLYGN